MIPELAFAGLLQLDECWEVTSAEFETMESKAKQIGRILVDAHHVHAEIGQARAGDQPYVSAPDNANLHRRVRLSEGAGSRKA